MPVIQPSSLLAPHKCLFKWHQLPEPMYLHTKHILPGHPRLPAQLPQVMTYIQYTQYCDLPAASTAISDTSASFPKTKYSVGNVFTSDTIIFAEQFSY